MFAKVNDTERGPVEYTEAGVGEPVLYFHGTGVTGDAMIRVESRIVDSGFRLIIPNRPGYGKTPLAPHVSAADCAHVAAALLNSLGLAEASVMGSSGGAAFAASFAIHYPDRVKSLVLLCPQLHRWDDKRWLPKTSRWTLPFLKRAFPRQVLLRLYRFQLPRMSVAQFLQTEAGDRYSDIADDPAAVSLGRASLEAMTRGTRCAGFENDFLVFLNEDLFGTRGSINSPTLLIHDTVDPLAPVDHVQWFISKVPHCQRAAIHAAGHLVWVGADAERMHKTRVEFLTEHAKRNS